MIDASWFLYIVRCVDGSLYTGVTKNISRRLAEHNSDNALAAKYTRGRRPVELVYRQSFATRSDACRREYEIKQLSRSQKEELILSARL